MSDYSNKKSTAPALEKGLMILETLSQQAQPLTLSQLANQMGKNVTEIQRMVAVLQSSNYLIRNAQGGYTLSSKLYQMALRYPPHRDLSLLLRPAMYDFVDHTEESIHLSILQERKMIVIAQVESPKIGRISLQLGQLQDPLETVSGRILLAHLDDQELQIIIEHGNYSKKEIDWLHQRIESIREHGYEHMESSVYAGLFDLGVPVQTSEGLVLGALTTSWLATKQTKSEQDRERVIDKLLNALRKALAQNME